MIDHTFVMRQVCSECQGKGFLTESYTIEELIDLVLPYKERGEKIYAIKMVRDMDGYVGLKDAKEIVEIIFDIGKEYLALNDKLINTLHLTGEGVN